MAKGLDIGTMNIVCASKDPKNPQSEVHIESVRDAFLDIEAEQSVLNMLKMSNTSFIQEKDFVYIIGEPALAVANMLKREARRPLSKGIISPGELDAEKVLSILIKSILKDPQVDHEIVYYSVPAKPVDRDMDIIYHEAMFKKIVENFGYKAKAMNEAAAIIYANCEKENFTALASSFGSGMINTSLLFQTMVGMSFSLSKAGDYIDDSAAKAVGTTATRIMSIKEKGVDLLDPAEGDPKNLREREAIIVYYRNLINNIINSIKKEFKKDQSTIELPAQIPWIISGGTAKAKNFLPFFQQEFNKVKDSFPISISEIRMARDPLNDVAKGLLIAAMND
jgi:actin-like ATPase involved in cell morphogenesis